MADDNDRTDEAGDSVGGGGRSPSPLQPRALHIRCPHCHNRVAVVADDSLVDVECPSCGSHFSLAGVQPTQAHTPAGAESIGNFRLVEQVGIGQVGSVWKAHDATLDRWVAIKIPRRGQLDPDEAALFFREARAAAQVRHPNIVSVHEVGREGDTLYIVSDFVEGANLKEWLSAQRLTPQEAAELCAKIADALHVAHEAGVVHRDLKPGNIMLDAAREPRITDFGLAKRESGEITMTMDGQVLGTPAYMPPEQARGRGHEADRRSDIYALGVILFELLTGELPFRGETRMLLLQILNDDPPSPRKLNSRIPRDLETICLKCLEKDPARRYPTAGELSEDLKRFLAGEPVIARSISPVERAWRWYRRHPEAIMLSAGIFMVTWSALLTLWILLGIVRLSISTYTSRSAGQMKGGCGVILLALLLLMWPGLQTLKGRLLGLWLGTLISAGGLVFSSLVWVYSIYSERDYGRPPTDQPLFSLIGLIALYSLVLHIAALVSRRAGES